MKNRTQRQKEYWAYADNNKGNYPEDTERSGKWLLFVPPEEIVNVWALIQENTENGLLGIASKTPGYGLLLEVRNIKIDRELVICVYTYDYKDKKDVDRILKKLRHLGLEKYGYGNILRYKDDEETRKGNYHEQGQKKSPCRYKSSDFHCEPNCQLCKEIKWNTPS